MHIRPTEEDITRISYREYPHDSKRSSVHENEKGSVGRFVNEAVGGAMGHLAYQAGETIAEGAMNKRRGAAGH